MRDYCIRPTRELEFAAGGKRQIDSGRRASHATSPPPIRTLQSVSWSSLSRGSESVFEVGTFQRWGRGGFVRQNAGQSDPIFVFMGCTRRLWSGESCDSTFRRKRSGGIGRNRSNIVLDVVASNSLSPFPWAMYPGTVEGVDARSMQWNSTLSGSVDRVDQLWEVSTAQRSAFPTRFHHNKKEAPEGC